MITFGTIQKIKHKPRRTHLSIISPSDKKYLFSIKEPGGLDVGMYVAMGLRQEDKGKGLITNSVIKKYNPEINHICEPQFKDLWLV